MRVATPRGRFVPAKLPREPVASWGTEAGRTSVESRGRYPGGDFANVAEYTYYTEGRRLRQRRYIAYVRVCGNYLAKLHAKLLPHGKRGHIEFSLERVKRF